MSDNYVGATRWAIITASDQVDIPEFVFSPECAPYLVIQTSERMLVFGREMIREMYAAWERADEGNNPL